MTVWCKSYKKSYGKYFWTQYISWYVFIYVSWYLCTGYIHNDAFSITNVVIKHKDMYVIGAWYLTKPLLSKWLQTINYIGSLAIIYKLHYTHFYQHHVL